MQQNTQLLGREFPFHISREPGTGRLLLAYRDGAELYDWPPERKLHSFEPSSADTEAVEGIETLCPWLAGPEQGEAGWVHAVASDSFTLIDRQLRPVFSIPLPGGESARKLIRLSPTSLLLQDENDQVWPIEILPKDLSAQFGDPWPVPCQPLGPAPKSKGVLCLEAGRLQLRDSHSGRLLHTWPGVHGVSTATLHPEGTAGLLFSENGRASYWDPTGGETLFELSTPLTLWSGVLCLEAPHRGAALSEDGDVLLFSAVDGGRVTVARGLPEPIHALNWDGTELLALDQSGKVWSLALDGLAEQIPGPFPWAGWCTAAAGWDDSFTLVGSAEGQVALFDGTGSLCWGPEPLHADSVVHLFIRDRTALSVGADGSVCRLLRNPSAELQWESLREPDGTTVVSCCFDPRSQSLGLGLEQGVIERLTIEGALPHRSWQLRDQRLEELSVGPQPGTLLAVTVQGGVRLLS